jgi:hypothetical protein
MIGGVSMKHLGQYLFSHGFVGVRQEQTVYRPIELQMLPVSDQSKNYTKTLNSNFAPQSVIRTSLRQSHTFVQHHHGTQGSLPQTGRCLQSLP